MPIFRSYVPGSPCWVDVMTPDVKAAKAFYGTVFGWEGEDADDGEGNIIYTNMMLNGEMICGMGAQPAEMAGAPAIWSTYIATTDAAATAEKITAAGGVVMMPPMQVMDKGTMAMCTDPTGAVFGLWQADTHLGAGLANEPNTWSWNELVTRDVPAALPFYSEVFGWTYEPQEMPFGTYNVIQGGPTGQLGGVMPVMDEMPAEVPNHWMTYFTTADLSETLAKVTEAGGSKVNGPDEVPGVGTLAIAADPQGGTFALMQPLNQD